MKFLLEIFKEIIKNNVNLQSYRTVILSCHLLKIQNYKSNTIL